MSSIKPVTSTDSHKVTGSLKDKRLYKMFFISIQSIFFAGPQTSP